MTSKRKAKIPASHVINVKPSSHQPSKAELEESNDMPRMSDKQLREAFFRPVKAIKKS